MQYARRLGHISLIFSGVVAAILGMGLGGLLEGSTSAVARPVYGFATLDDTAARFTVAPHPVIVGSVKVGGTLGVNVGNFSPTADHESYQWKRDGASIAGATGAHLLITENMAGHKLTISVTGHKTGFSNKTVTSHSVTVPKPGAAHPATQQQDIAFSTYIANYGGQAAVDACTGGLTEDETVGGTIGKLYLPIHNGCGGRPILFLETGDLVSIANLGTYKVVGSLEVKEGDSASVLVGLPGTVLIQTCDDTGLGMRVVALAEA